MKASQNKMVKWFGRGLVGIVIIGASLWLLPHALGVYYQVRGGLKLTEAFDPSTSQPIGIACLEDFLPDADQKFLLERSINDFEVALQYDSGLVRANLLRGRAFCLLGKPQKAAQVFLEYLAARPDSPLGYLELAAVFHKLADQRGEDFSMFGDSQVPPPDSYTGQAIVEWQNAGVTGEDMVKAGDQFLKQKKYNTALIWYSRALLLQPGLITVWSGAGKAYEGLGNWDQALDAYMRAINLNSRDAQAYYLIGGIYSRDKNYIEADEWYTLAVQYNPDQPWYQLARANNLRDLGNLAGAISQYEQIITDFNPFPDVYYHLANVYRLNGQVQDAVEAIEKALELVDTPDAGYYLRAGTIYEGAGLIESAIKAYHQVLVIDPENQKALAAIERLEK